MVSYGFIFTPRGRISESKIQISRNNKIFSVKSRFIFYCGMRERGHLSPVFTETKSNEVMRGISKKCSEIFANLHTALVIYLH